MINTELTNVDRIKYSTFAAVENLMHYSDKYKKGFKDPYNWCSLLNEDAIEENTLEEHLMGFNREQDKIVHEMPNQASFTAFPKLEILVSLKEIAIVLYCKKHQLEFHGNATRIEINAQFTWNDLYHEVIKDGNDLVDGYFEMLTYYYNQINRIVLSDDKEKKYFYHDLLNGICDENFDAICRFQDVGMTPETQYGQVLREMFKNHVISLYDFNKYVAPNILTSFRKHREITNALGLYVDDYTNDFDIEHNDLGLELKRSFPNCDEKHFNRFYAEMMNRQSWELKENSNQETFLSMTELIIVSYIENVMMLMEVPEWCQRERILFTIIDWNYLSQEIFPQFSKTVQKHLRPILQMGLDICKLSGWRLNLINTSTLSYSRLNDELEKIPNYTNKK